MALPSMRTTLMFSLLLLALVFVCRPREARDVGPIDASGYTQLRAYSAGPGLRGPTVRGTELFDAIVVDDAFLTASYRLDGLRAAVIGVDREVRRYRNYDLATSTPAAADFLRLCRGSEPGTLLALSACGRVDPAGVGADRRRAELQAALDLLGAETTPLQTPGVSWSWIGFRAKQGWVKLGETLSNTSGTVLAFSVAPDLSLYEEDFEPTCVFERTAVVHLRDYVDRSVPTEEARFVPAATVAGRTLPAIVMSDFGGRRQRRFRWQGLRLGGSPQFGAGLALVDRHSGLKQTAHCQLLVDGEVVRNLLFGGSGHPPDTWRDLRATLDAFAGLSVELELRVTFGEPDLGAFVVWGDPALGFSVDVGRDTEATLFGARERSLVFFGHAYPLNGFDKRGYGNYLGWTGDAQEPVSADGHSMRARLATENDRPILMGFYGALRDAGADRLVWGGDSLYTTTPASAAYFQNLTKYLADVPQVLLPGNHDYQLLRTVGTNPELEKSAGQEETIDGARLVYLDTVTHEGRVMNPARADSRPTKAWLDALRAKLWRLPAAGVHSWVIFMHHAPWFLQDSAANVDHAQSPWWREVHPILAKLTEEHGLTVYVVAGDAGDRCFADGRDLAGVHYVVSGQPRYDGDVPYGFLRLAWTVEEPVRIAVHTWTPEGGFVVHDRPEWPWQY